MDVGERVYVPGVDGAWPLGNGVVTDIVPKFRQRDQWTSVTLDSPARRHESDGEPRKDWLVRMSVLKPPVEDEA